MGKTAGQSAKSLNIDRLWWELKGDNVFGKGRSWEMRLKFIKQTRIPGPGIWTFKDIVWKPVHSGCDQPCKCSSCLTSIYSWYQPILFRHQAYQDQISSLDDRQPIIVPECLRAFKGGGDIGFLSVCTSKATAGSYLYFLSLSRGIPLSWLI